MTATHGTTAAMGDMTTGGSRTSRGSTMTGSTTTVTGGTTSGSRATGGTTTVTSGTTTWQNEGDGDMMTRHDDGDGRHNNLVKMGAR